MEIAWAFLAHALSDFTWAPLDGGGQVTWSIIRRSDPCALPRRLTADNRNRRRGQRRRGRICDRLRRRRGRRRRDASREERRGNQEDNHRCIMQLPAASQFFGNVGHPLPLQLRTSNNKQSASDCQQEQTSAGVTSSRTVAQNRLWSPLLPTVRIPTVSHTGRSRIRDVPYTAA